MISFHSVKMLGWLCLILSIFSSIISEAVGGFFVLMAIILFVYGERLHIRQCPDYAEYRLMKKEMALKNREQQKKLKSERLAEEALRRVKENDAKKKLAAEKKKKEQEFRQMRNELRKRGIPSCPKCGSTHIVTISKRLCRTIFFDYKCENVKNICQLCGHEFDPGE